MPGVLLQGACLMNPMLKDARCNRCCDCVFQFKKKNLVDPFYHSGFLASQIKSSNVHLDHWLGAKVAAGITACIWDSNSTLSEKLPCTEAASGKALTTKKTRSFPCLVNDARMRVTSWRLLWRLISGRCQIRRQTWLVAHDMARGPLNWEFGNLRHTSIDMVHVVKHDITM